MKGRDFILDSVFQYATTVALNYEEVESHPERVSSIKSFSKELGKNKLTIKNR